MNDNRSFVLNQKDLSTHQGFQFEFFCDRCNENYRSVIKLYTPPVQPTEVTNVTFMNAPAITINQAEIANATHWQEMRGRAYLEVVREIIPNFVQCPRCGSWVCKRKCWNEEKNLCYDCAPVFNQQMTQDEKAYVMEKTAWQDEAISVSSSSTANKAGQNQEVNPLAVPLPPKPILTCPRCFNQVSEDEHYCPHCGHNLKTGASFILKICSKCKTALPDGVKFCPKCGEKVK